MVNMMLFVEYINSWMVEDIMLPVSESISPESCDDQLDSIVNVRSIGVVIEEGAVRHFILEGSLIPVSGHCKWPSADCGGAIHAEQGIPDFIHIKG